MASAATAFVSFPLYSPRSKTVAASEPTLVYFQSSLRAVGNPSFETGDPGFPEFSTTRPTTTAILLVMLKGREVRFGFLTIQHHRGDLPGRYWSALASLLIQS